MKKSLIAIPIVAALGLTGCAATESITVGSQSYYSNEIIAEIYAQALEENGFEVERRYAIGQREAYVPALEAGEVDLFPEYTGNLLQYYNPEATATAADEVYSALQSELPQELTALAMSPATDQDSYNVTAEFAEAQGISSLADLAGVSGLILGGNPELEERPYGPQGLFDVYGAEVGFEATGDLTFEALLEGEINMANIYSGDPRIAQFDLVTLADPEGMFLSSNVVPIANSSIADDVANVINAVSVAMSPQELVELNNRSQQEELSSAVIANDWLVSEGLKQ
ncbi:MAG TPA: ABC transporter substrate-binding protein [Microbacteriaceae bacterium]